MEMKPVLYELTVMLGDVTEFHISTTSMLGLGFKSSSEQDPSLAARPNQGDIQSCFSGHSTSENSSRSSHRPSFVRIFAGKYTTETDHLLESSAVASSFSPLVSNAVF